MDSQMIPLKVQIQAKNHFEQLFVPLNGTRREYNTELKFEDDKMIFNWGGEVP